MFTDRTCYTCLYMMNSEYGLEEPHQAHCGIEHGVDEHYSEVGITENQEEYMEDYNTTVNLVCGCCTLEYATSPEDRKLGMVVEDGVVRYWCLPCNTEQCAYTDCGEIDGCLVLEHWIQEQLEDRPDDPTRIYAENAAAEWEEEEEDAEVDRLRHEQLIADAMSWITLSEGLLDY